MEPRVPPATVEKRMSSAQQKTGEGTFSLQYYTIILARAVVVDSYNNLNRPKQLFIFY